MDNREGEGRGVPAGVQVPQDSPSCLGNPLIEALLGLPPDSEQLGGLQRQTTVNGAGGHHRCDSGYRSETTARGSGDRRGGYRQPSTLADEVWGGKYGAQADFRGIWVLDGQRSPTLVGLQVTDVGAPCWTQQVPWGKASQSGGDLASDVGKVRSGSDGGGVQRGLRDGATLW